MLFLLCSSGFLSHNAKEGVQNAQRNFDSAVVVRDYGLPLSWLHGVVEKGNRYKRITSSTRSHQIVLDVLCPDRRRVCPCTFRFFPLVEESFLSLLSTFKSMVQKSV